MAEKIYTFNNLPTIEHFVKYDNWVTLEVVGDTTRIYRSSDDNGDVRFDGNDRVQVLEEALFTFEFGDGDAQAYIQTHGQRYPEYSGYPLRFYISASLRDGVTTYGTFAHDWRDPPDAQTPGGDNYTILSAPQLSHGVEYTLRIRVEADQSISYSIKTDPADDQSWVLVSQTEAGRCPLWSEYPLDITPYVALFLEDCLPVREVDAFFKDVTMRAAGIESVSLIDWVNRCYLGGGYDSPTIDARLLSHYAVEVVSGFEEINGMEGWSGDLNPQYFENAILSEFEGNLVSTNEDPLRFSNLVACEGDIYLELNCRYLIYPGPLTFFINDHFIELGFIYSDTETDYYGIAIDGVFHGVASNDTYFYIQMEVSDNYCQVAMSYGAGIDVMYSSIDFLGSPSVYRYTAFKFATREQTAIFEWDHFLLRGQKPTVASYFRGEIISDLLTRFDLSVTPPSRSPGFFLHKTKITGGTADALDGIDPLNIDSSGIALTPGSTCLVITDQDDIYIYRAYNTGGQVGSLPEIIIPFYNPGDWYWQLVEVKAFKPAKAVQYTDLDTGGPFDYDYYQELLWATTVDDATGTVDVASIGVEPESTGVYSTGGPLSGKTNVLLLPYIPMKAFTT